MSQPPVNSVPRHVAVIMDGNGRWAKERHLPRLAGHNAGAKAVERTLKAAQKAGVKFLTLYAFSTENWNRSKAEISGLFHLMDSFFKKKLDNCIANGVKIRIAGNRQLLSKDTLNLIERVESATDDCTALTLTIALSYGGRDELIRAIQKCTSDVKLGIIDSEKIGEQVFSTYLDTKDCPDIDLVVRTGGNHRLSNFFPWQTVYAEIYFTDILWPDFSYQDFCDIIQNYEDIQINKGK